MTKREENKLSMFKATNLVLKQNSELYAEIPVIAESQITLESIIQSIEQMDVDFKEATKGKTADKTAKAEALINQAYRLTNAIYVYGVKTKNHELMEDFKIGKGTLSTLRDTDLPKKVSKILSTAETIKAELVQYGISQADITAVSNALDEYKAAFDAQAETMTATSADRAKLYDLFDQADGILYDEVDPLLELFVEKNADFYNQYQSARVIKDL